jgi:hypothetical protein
VTTKTDKTRVSVTHRFHVDNQRHGTDSFYRDELAGILKEVVGVAGPVVSGSDYPVFARGRLWAFKFGIPRDGQEHYIEFDYEADAMFYILKHGGVIIDCVEDVELAWAK